MNLSAIPRHQIETTLGDYARMIPALVGLSDRVSDQAKFEKQFARYVDCRHAIAVASGRFGLHLVLKHMGLEAGTDAIIPAFNLFAVVERFLDAGIQPVFADVGRYSLNVDPAKAESSITPRTRVLLATQMFGNPCEMDALCGIADRHNLILLEDCAHAFGSMFRGKHVGTFGKAGVFSLSTLKLITTFGGGVITTNDDDLARRIRFDLEERTARAGLGEGVKRFVKGTILDLGTRSLPFSIGAWPTLRLAQAFNPSFQELLMTESPDRTAGWQPMAAAPFHAFQSRLGISQLRRVHGFIARRREIMKHLDESLQGIPGIESCLHASAAGHNGMYYGVLAERSRDLRDYLFKRGIDAETAEYRNCADLKIYGDYRVDCPVAREVESRILRLPNHPRMTSGHVDRIAAAIRAFYTL